MVSRRNSFVLALALLLPGGASAENAFQVRYFYPSAGLEGLVFDGNYQTRVQKAMLSLSVPELSADKQNFRASYSSGPLYSMVSFDRSWYRQGSGLLALLSYTSPRSGWLTQGNVTYLRNEDERPLGYIQNNVTLTVGGNVTNDWKWTAGGTYERMWLRSIPDDPTITRSGFVGVNGKADKLTMQSRVQYGLSETATRGNTQQLSATLFGEYVLTEHEKLTTNLFYGRTAMSLLPDPFQYDSEDLQLSSTRLSNWLLTAKVNRASSTLGARLSAEYRMGGGLRVGAAYGVALTAPTSQFGEFSVAYQKNPWTARGALSVQSTPGAGGTMQLGLMPSLNLNYLAGENSGSLNANASYLPGLAQPWTYHLDGNLKAVRGQWSWIAGVGVDSPNSRQPLTAQVSLQSIYQASEHLGWNTSARYLLDSRGSRTQFGLGVKYVF